jgi:membrane dipeptidase
VVADGRAGDRVLSFFEPAAGPDSEIVGAVLRAMPVVDGHNDLPSRLRESAGYSVEGLDGHRPELHTDIPRLRAGGVGAQFWSVYVPGDQPEAQSVVDTLEQIDTVYRMVARWPDAFAIAYTAADVERTIGNRLIASLLGVEGGHSIAGSLGVLRAFARLGIRYLTLTHNHSTAWADSATDEPRAGGLSDVGRAIVAEMNRLGVLVDISHVAASTQHAALDASTAPVIFSHSSCRAISSHPRNAGDDVLARLADNGGVIQITFVPEFVSQAVADWKDALRAERDRLGLTPEHWPWPRAPHPGEGAAQAAAKIAVETAAPPVDERMAAWLAAHPRPQASAAQVADHVEHARDVAGIDHIGLGGDFDGVDHLPVDLADVSRYPVLVRELAARGWSRADLEKLTGRNILRALHEAERVATNPLWPITALR